MSVCVDEDVRRSEITVGDTASVCGGERAGDLFDDLSARVGAERGAAVEDRSEVAAVEASHHEVCAAVLAPVVVHRNDAGVLEPGHGAGLCFESADEVGVVGHLRADDLGDRDLTSDGRLEGSVDVAGGARADQFAQLVATDQQPQADEAGGAMGRFGRSPAWGPRAGSAVRVV